MVMFTMCEKDMQYYSYTGSTQKCFPLDRVIILITAFHISSDSVYEEIHFNVDSVRKLILRWLSVRELILRWLSVSELILCDSVKEETFCFDPAQGKM